MKADQAFPVSRKIDVTRTRSNSNKTETAPSFSNLRKLINTKITIGQTAEGKTLVGKIINVKKKPVNVGITSELRMTHLTRTYPTAKHKNLQMSGVVANDLGDNEVMEVDSFLAKIEINILQAIDSVNTKKSGNKIPASKTPSSLKVPNRLTTATKQGIHPELFKNVNSQPPFNYFSAIRCSQSNFRNRICNCKSPGTDT